MPSGVRGGYCAHRVVYATVVKFVSSREYRVRGLLCKFFFSCYSSNFFLAVPKARPGAYFSERFPPFLAKMKSLKITGPSGFSKENLLVFSHT